MQNQFHSATRSKSRRAVEAFPVASKRVLVADEDPAFLPRVTGAIDRNGFTAVARVHSGGARQKHKAFKTKKPKNDERDAIEASG